MVSMKELERWMTTGQVSKRLGRSRQGVIDLAEDRRLRAVKVGGQVWIYDPASVEAFGRRELERGEGE
jgi:excisionase family DNA binding protein